MRFQAMPRCMTRPRTRTFQWKCATRLVAIGLYFLATAPLASGQVPGILLHTFPNPLSSSSDAVAISGAYLVTGDSALSNGNAYVYDLKSATPNVPALTLTYPNQAAGDRFGYSVAILGSRVVVGCPASRFSWTTNYPGKVFLYDLASPIPEVPVMTFTNVNWDLHESGLGFSVAVSDRWVVAGAWRNDTASSPAGTVHVFDLEGQNPTIPTMIWTNPGPEGSSGFGTALAMAGTRVVVGSPYDHTGKQYSGSAHIYDLAGANPTQPLVVLTNPSPSTDAFFGLSVAISGNRVVTGAGWDDTSGFNAGIAYVYDLASATPDIPALTLTNPSPASSDFFGSAVVISGNLAVVGAYGDDTGANGAGIVYVFDLASTTPTLPVATLMNPYPAQFASMGRALAMDGAMVAAMRGVHLFGPQPGLNLAQSAPDLLTLSWTPTTSSGFTLQYAESVPPTNWFDAASGETNPVTIAATNAARFYRLFKP